MPGARESHAGCMQVQQTGKQHGEYYSLELVHRRRLKKKKKKRLQRTEAEFTNGPGRQAVRLRALAAWSSTLAGPPGRPHRSNHLFISTSY